MSSWIWVLTITVLGPNPEHHSYAKYQSKEECYQALEMAKQDYANKKKKITGSCNLVLKSSR